MNYFFSVNFDVRVVVVWLPTAAEFPRKRKPEPLLNESNQSPRVPLLDILLLYVDAIGVEHRLLSSSFLLN